jgi:hypothetical protein
MDTAASPLGSAVPSHTPGPWVIDRDQDGRCLINGERQFVCTIDAPVCESHEANARLIAAAPDLLAALKELRKHFLIAWGYEPPIGSIHRPVTDRAGDAIAKAEGFAAQSTSVRKDAALPDGCCGYTDADGSCCTPMPEASGSNQSLQGE